MRAQQCSSTTTSNQHDFHKLYRKYSTAIRHLMYAVFVFSTSTTHTNRMNFNNNELMLNK